MRSFGLEWACRMDFYGCKAVSEVVVDVVLVFSSLYGHFPYNLCIILYVHEPQFS